TIAAFPLMHLSLFNNKTFSLANTVCMISYFVQQLITYLMPFYLINSLQLNPGAAGLIMLASPIFMMTSSPAGGILCDKKGTRLPAGLGLVMICAGCLIMVLFSRTAAFGVAIVTLLLVGTGNGFSVSSINTAIIGAAPAEHVGIASGMLATMRNFGQTLGVLSGSIIFALRQPVYGLFPERKAYLFAQRDTFFFGVLMVVIAMALVWLLPHNPAKKADTRRR
ncbi:MAG: MFS transporter, partial [Treponema sp.]|nr:MFS transporter [Treponema sp.]